MVRDQRISPRKRGFWGRIAQIAERAFSHSGSVGAANVSWKDRQDLGLIGHSVWNKADSPRLSGIRFFVEF
jgi:hypothetical protein